MGLRRAAVNDDEKSNLPPLQAHLEELVAARTPPAPEAVHGAG
jgi:hypothetical protein